MLNKKKILILIDSNKKIGNGHYIRTNAIKNAYNKDKKKIIILINLSLKKLDKNMIKKLKNIDLVIFDTPVFYKEIFLFFKFNNINILGLDWFHSYKPDYNISIFPHKKVNSIKKSYVGLQYIILRKTITNLPIKNVSNNKILIVIGGGDINNQGFKAAKFLIKKGNNITLIKGPLANYPKSSKFNIISNPNNYNRILNSHNNIITNGGGCLFEAIFLKKKVFVLPQSEKEEKVANFFKNKKLIIDCGYKKLNKYHNLLNEYKLPNLKIIDDKGIKRIILIINKILS